LRTGLHVAIQTRLGLDLGDIPFVDELKTVDDHDVLDKAIRMNAKATQCLMQKNDKGKWRSRSSPFQIVRAVLPMPC